MERLKLILTGGLLTSMLGLAIAMTVLVVSEIQPVQADIPIQTQMAIVENNIKYMPLTDAPPQRDITAQRFAP